MSFAKKFLIGCAAVERGIELNNGISPLSPILTPYLNPPPGALELRLLLVHMHDAGHERMQGTDVTKGTFAGKSMLELVVGIQTF